MSPKSLIKAFFALFFLAASAKAVTYKPGFAEELLTDGLNQPTAIAVAPDGRIFVAEKEGKIRIIEQGALLPAPFLDIEVDAFGERGLSHILLDRDFDNTGYIYLYYNVKNGEHNRISRFTANGNTAVPGSELILMDLAELGSTMHNGGTMRWGMDGKLYVSTGEGAIEKYSQSFDNALGKMLRLNADGSIPTDNPYYGSTSGNARAIYAMGLRNPFSFDIDPLSGRIFLNDVGLSDWEEVNEIKQGRNYGWPLVEGYLTNQTPPADYEDPLFAYGHDAGCAVVGGAVFNYPNSDYPPEIQNHFLFGDFCSGTISMLDLNTNMVTDTFAKGIFKMTNLTADPSNGTLLYCQLHTGKLFRIRYIGTGAPFISEHPKSITVPVGEDATFAVSAVAADSMQYEWYRDGLPMFGETSPTLTLANVQLAFSGTSVTCRVFNAQGSVTSDPAVLTVTTNTRPQVAITSPNPGLRYRAGDTIFFHGTVTDAEDVTVPINHQLWTIDFHHDTHTHPVISSAVVQGVGSFVVPRVGETDTNVWYGIHLDATDSEGLEGSDFVEIFPVFGRVELKTEPQGLQVTVDGADKATPLEVHGVVGTERRIGAPAQQLRNDSLFRFVRWKERSGDAFEVWVPDNPVTYTAEYEFVARFFTGDGDGLLAEYWDNINLLGAPGHSQVEPNVYYRFEWEAPISIADWALAQSFGRDSFAIRWTGDLMAPLDGKYTLHFSYDDRVRMFLDGVQVLDQWDSFGGEDSVSLSLKGGQRYTIQIDYAELRWTSRIQFTWRTPFATDLVPVPQSQLYSEHLVATQPVPAFDSSFVFPVPMQDILHIYVHDHDESGQSEVKVEIYTAQGRIVQSLLVPVSFDSPGEIDVSGLPAGRVYFVKLFNGGRVTWIRAPKF